jgi:hypothetical protein
MIYSHLSASSRPGARCGTNLATRHYGSSGGPGVRGEIIPTRGCLVPFGCPPAIRRGAAHWVRTFSHLYCDWTGNSMARARSMTERDRMVTCSHRIHRRGRTHGSPPFRIRVLRRDRRWRTVRFQFASILLPNARHRVAAAGTRQRVVTTVRTGGYADCVPPARGWQEDSRTIRLHGWLESAGAGVAEECGPESHDGDGDPAGRKAECPAASERTRRPGR